MTLLHDPGSFCLNCGFVRQPGSSFGPCPRCEGKDPKNPRVLPVIFKTVGDVLKDEEWRRDEVARHSRELNERAAMESYPNSRNPSKDEAIARVAELLSRPHPPRQSKHNSKPEPELATLDDDDEDFHTYRLDDFPPAIGDFCAKYYDDSDGISVCSVEGDGT